MSANSRWQEMISDNLASASIPGFKKQDVSFAAIQAGLLATSHGLTPNTLPQASLSTNFAPGELKPTGSSTDVAIDGPGFFQVQLPNGSTGYTRNGEFHLNAQGQLTTNAGQLVLGDSGPIQLDRNNPAPISISATGEVSQGSDQKGKLQIMDFNDPHLLTQIGGGCFISNDPQLTASPVASPSVRQGYLESANTSPVAEMANLITVMRTFEANQRIVQLNDDRMGRAITELGSPT